MSSEWTTSSLLDHYEVRSGLSKPAKEFGSGHPFLTFKDVFYNYFTPESLGDFVQSTEKEREACSVLRGDVFLTRTSETMHELGMSCVALRDYENATFNGFCKRLRPKPESELLPEYVGYYLRSPKFRQSMLAMSTMSTRASLNNEMIGRLEISFPSRQLQAQISEVLKSLDDRITLLRASNTTLEAIAQALFKSWFVDFDPVHAKQQGRAPEGMDAQTAALFPDAFEDSELGMVPKGWSYKTMSDVSTVGIGKTPPRKEPQWFSENSQDIRWVSIRDMGDYGTYAFKTSEFLTNEAVEKFNVRRIPKNTVLMSFKLTVGRLAISHGELTSNEAIAHFKLEENPILSTEYIYLALKNFNFSSLSSTSSIADAVNSKTVRELPILVPRKEVLDSFQNIISSIFEKIKLCEQQAIELADLRDTLLPRLISGQLRLPEAQALVEATVDA